jgi:hypothetical protein
MIHRLKDNYKISIKNHMNKIKIKVIKLVMKINHNNKINNRVINKIIKINLINNKIRKKERKIKINKINKIKKIIIKNS